MRGTAIEADALTRYVGSRDRDAAFQEGTGFRELGDFVRTEYMQFGYTKGAAQEARFVREALGLREGDRVLDVACGLGRHARFLTRRHAVVGIDLSRGLLEAAGEHAGGMLRVQADARCLPFRGAFDAAYSMCEGAFGLLGGDEEHVRMLRSVHDALRPGGRFLLQAMSAFYMAFDDSFDPVTNVMIDEQEVRGPDGSTRRFSVATRAFTPREVLRMGEEAGFAAVAIHGGITGAYRLRRFKVSDAEMLVVFERPGE